MPRYAAFLRGVNLGGSTQVSMDSLRECLAGEGFRDVRTLLQSGNAVFEAEEKSSGAVERRAEAAVESAFGRKIEVLVRNPSAWASVISANPFRAAAASDPARLTVLLLKRPPPAAAWATLAQGIVGSEEVRPGGSHGYLHYPDGQGRSRLTLDRIEKTLGVRGTVRNWNTVRKVATLLGE